MLAFNYSEIDKIVVNYLIIEKPMEEEKEQEEDTKIKIDADAIVSKINKEIHQNYDEYKKENAGFEVWLEQNCKYALDNFSLSIF